MQPDLWQDFRIHGVTVEFVTEIVGLDFPDFAPEKLTDMRIHGVTAAFARELQKSKPHITLDEVMDRVINGEMV